MGIELKIHINEKLFLKNPQDSDLGRTIVKHSILLIEEIGFESFTFKKLATKTNSVEASIYRYFKNKHRLFLYLSTWYWKRCEYLIKSNTENINDPKLKMEVIVRLILLPPDKCPLSPSYINEMSLHRIIISEGIKSFRKKNVSEEDALGFFAGYKNLIKTIANVILEINPNFKYPRSLASTLFEMSKNYLFFTRHLPLLSDFELKDDKIPFNEIEKMLNYFIEKILNS